jgi:hypothetical protein
MRIRCRVYPLIWAAMFATSTAAPAAEKAGQAKLPPVKEIWLASETPSFTVVGNVSARKLTEIAETLERFRTTLLKLKPDANPVTPVPNLFVAFSGDRSFTPYKGSPDPGRAKWVGTYQASPFGNDFAVNAYPDQGNGMAIVFEAYAAHFIRSNYPSTPLWLQEGLAEIYGTFRIEDDVADVGRPSADNLRVLRSSVLLPLREVLAMTSQSPGYLPEKRGVFEAQAWILSHYLLYGSADGQLRTADFLRRLDSGEEQAAAFASAFGVGIDGFEGRLRLYAGQPAYPYLRVNVSDLPPAGASVPRALRRAEALTWLANLPAHRGDLDFAQLHLDAALAEEPELADAWALAGWIAESRHDAAGAARAYSRALGGGVRQAASWLYIGRWQLDGVDNSESSRAPADRKAGAAAARQSAEQALALAPELGEAAALKGRAALVQEDYGAAVVALAEAQLRLPERTDIVYNRVIALLGAGQMVPARALTEGRLRRLADPATLAQARAMVAAREASLILDAATEAANRALSAGDLDGAVAALTEAQARAGTAEAKAVLGQRIASLGEAQRERNEVGAFNAAVADTNAGRLTRARDALRTLVADCRTSDLCARATELLADLERRLKSRP